MSLERILIYQNALKFSYRKAEIGEKTYYSFTIHPMTMNEYRKMPHALPYCQLSGIVSFCRKHRDHIRSESCYVEATMAGLLYNNYDTIDTFEELSDVFELWIMAWIDNEKYIKDHYKGPVEAFRKKFWKTSKPDRNDLEYYSLAESTPYWYPLEIELVADSKQRRKLKIQKQNQARVELIKLNLKETADDFMITAFGVLPTAKFLADAYDLKMNAVYTHGREFFTKNQTYELVQAIRALDPDITQKKMVTELAKYGVRTTLRTVKRHWKPE